MTDRWPMSCLFVLFAVVILVQPVAAATLHVPSAYPTIQAGVDAALDGDTVLLADGTYSGEGNHDIDFLGKAITVRSVSGPEACIIRCFPEERGFLFDSGEGPTSVLQGITIMTPNYPSGLDRGGAIICLGSSPTITGNSIDGCNAHLGGGIYCEGGQPAILDNIFECMALSEPDITSKGGGIAIFDGSAPLISGNTFNSWVTGRGGGIYSENSSPVIIGNQFSCTAVSFQKFGVLGTGGGIFCRDGGLVESNSFEGCDAFLGGGIHVAGPVEIRGNMFSGNSCTATGGAIWAGEAVQIENNVLTDNSCATPWEAGGIELAGAGSRVSGCLITGNEGYGISCTGTGACSIENTLIKDNHTALSNFGELAITSCTITGDHAGYDHSLHLAGDTRISDSIIWANTPVQWVFWVENGAVLSIDHCNLEGGKAGIALVGGASLVWGAGMIDADPLFVTGPGGSHYLAQTAAGQALDSPCVDAGSATATDLGLDRTTTRSDLAPDEGRVDLGYHYPAAGSEPETVITGGPEGVTDSPVVCFSFAGTASPALTFSHRLDAGPWSEYSAATDACYEDIDTGSHTFEVRSRDAAGLVDPSPAARIFSAIPWDEGPWANLVTGPGPGPLNPPLVRTPLAQWTAYGVYRHGVNVACGDLDGDGSAEVVTGPGPGADFGPHVRGWELDGTPLSGVGFQAYGTLKYGVNVACGDLDGDGFDEIVTGAGPGVVFGPHVRAWDCDGGAATPIPEVSYFAYGTLKYGVNVACGDIDGDGFDEVVTGAGPGAVFGPHVRAWNWDGGGSVDPFPGISFLAYGTPKWGVNVACGDFDGDGLDEIVTGPGPGSVSGAHVRGWNCDGGAATPMPGVSFFAYDTLYGSVAGTGDIDGDGIDEILTMPGPGPGQGAHLRAWNADGGTVALIPDHDFFAYDHWYTHGGRVAGTVHATRRSTAGTPPASRCPEAHSDDGRVTGATP